MPEAPRTIGDLLERAAGSPDTGLRVLDRDLAATWLGWPTVLARALRAAAWLRDTGVRPGDRVGLVFPTDPAFFDAFFGTLLAGAVPVPLYPPVRLGRLDEYRARTAAMLRAAGARLVLADRRVYRVLGEVARDARPALGCRVLETRDNDAPPGWDTARRAPAAAPAANPDDLALVQFSSGTTVDPKPVALTHRALVAQVQLLNSFWPDADGVRHSGVSWLPLYHDMGLIGCVLAALERPGTLTLVPPELFVARPAAWLQTISRYRASVSPAPTFGFSVALQRIRDEDLEGVDLSCWRVALCGAETVVPDVMRAFADRFGRWGFAREALTPVYGLSEAALAVTFSDIRRPFVSTRFDRDLLADAGLARETPDGREIVSVGRPLPGFEVRVVDDEGRALAEGHAGSIECRGPSVMQRYLGNAEATAHALHDGWLVTGDVGFTWRGELYLSGRRKDLLLVRGGNHSPEEVESAVCAVGDVRAGCVVAVSWLPEGADGERLLVFAEAARGVPASRFASIAAGCRRAVLAATGLAVDRAVVLAPGTLPRTSSGKLRRQDTLKQYLAGTLHPPSPVTRLRLAGALARSALAHLRLKLNLG